MIFKVQFTSPNLRSILIGLNNSNSIKGERGRESYQCKSVKEIYRALIGRIRRKCAIIHNWNRINASEFRQSDSRLNHTNAGSHGILFLTITRVQTTMNQSKMGEMEYFTAALLLRGVTTREKVLMENGLLICLFQQEIIFEGLKLQVCFQFSLSQ